MKAHYRRGRSIQLGGLTIRRPLFLEMNLGGLVRGTPGPVVGVIGAQLFWRCELGVYLQSKTPTLIPMVSLTRSDSS